MKIAKGGARARTTIMIMAPIVAIATSMIGLRIGAGDPVLAAVVIGAPPGKPLVGGETPLAWQIRTVLDERGVKEVVATKGVTLIARARDQVVRVAGETNADGVLEVSFAIDGLVEGDPLDLEIRREGDPDPLAAGRIAWRDADAKERARALVEERGLPNVARPTVREGAIEVDVSIEGERLIPGFPTPGWARITAPPGVDLTSLTIEATPEPGLEIALPRRRPCRSVSDPRVGWVELALEAHAHVVGLELRATTGRDGGAASEAASGDGGATASGADGGDGGTASGAAGGDGGDGRWFGRVPVAAGAFYVDAPRMLRAGEPATAAIVAAGPRLIAYAELQDDRGGRVAAAALEPRADATATPRARFALPALTPGRYWIVVSGEPNGGETLGGATIAHPLLVTGEGPGDGVPDRATLEVWCGGFGPWLAERGAPGAARWVALDGSHARSAKNATHRRLGMLLSVGSLLAAGVLEALLLIAASRASRASALLAALEAAEDSSDDEARGEGEGARDALTHGSREDRRASAARVTAEAPGGTLAIGLLLALLGFGLLAVLFLAKG